MSPEGGRSAITVVDVRLKAITRYAGARATTYTVRWSVNGKPHQRTFSTKRLAEHFRSELQIAARAAAPFSAETGLPLEQTTSAEETTWLALAYEFVDHTWPRVSPRHRKGVAEALTALTLALLNEQPRAISKDTPRRTLFSWCFNTPARAVPAPPELRAAAEWLERLSPTLEEVSEARTLHRALATVSTRADGRTAAPSTGRKKHAALHSVLAYGVEQPLKHRAERATRVVPATPELVATLLRRHLEEHGVGIGGRLFVIRTGKAGVPLAAPYATPIAQGTAYRVWKRARAASLTPEQLASPLAQRPYDLRHACLSTWLNAGVPATQVAAWAGHSVMVLLRVYAQCLEGQDEVAMRQIEAALGQSTSRQTHPDE